MIYALLLSLSLAFGQPGMIKRSLRTKMIEQAQLQSETAKMDELDKDIFVLRLRTKTLDELKSLYPGIPPRKLANIMKFVSSMAVTE